MKHIILALFLTLFTATSAHAQALPVDHLTPALPTQSERHIADIASYVTVGLNIALDTKASWDSPERGRAFAMQGVRLGVTFGAAQLTKVLVHRERPCYPSDCGIDSPTSSFYSMHTAYAFQALGGPRLAISLPLAIGTGGLRIAADKHYLTDVLVGAGVGWATSHIR